MCTKKKDTKDARREDQRKNVVVGTDVLIFEGDEDDFVQLLAVFTVHELPNGVACDVGGVDAWITVYTSTYCTKGNGSQIVLHGQL